jgi:hypothetical protein
MAFESIDDPVSHPIARALVEGLFTFVAYNDVRDIYPGDQTLT